MHLYHVPATRSTRVLWTLEEAGADYDVTVIAREDRQTPDHRARHPLGRVPVAQENGRHVFESAALCLHVADSNPESGLIPPPGTTERALVYQWISFAMTELEPAVVEVSSQRESDPERAAKGTERAREATQVLERELEGHEFLVGDRFSVADVVCSAVLGFARRFGVTEGFPNVEAYVERMEERPARQRANAVGT